MWILALAASESAQPTVSGRIEAGVLFGAFLALSVGGWLVANRGRRQLEVGRSARANARAAYRRAASAQRAFAGQAPSADERAARLSEADRIDGKARG